VSAPHLSSVDLHGAELDAPQAGAVELLNAHCYLRLVAVEVPGDGTLKKWHA